MQEVVFVAVYNVYITRLEDAKKEMGESLKLESYYRTILNNPSYGRCNYSFPRSFYQSVAVEA